jgi:hypothetical protein
MLFAAGNDFEAVTALATGGQRFVFHFDVVDGCQECSTGYRERAAFDFDAGGSYLGASLLGLCRSAPGGVELPGTAACPPTQP